MVGMVLCSVTVKIQTETERDANIMIILTDIVIWVTISVGMIIFAFHFYWKKYSCWGLCQTSMICRLGHLCSTTLLHIWHILPLSNNLFGHCICPYCDLDNMNISFCCSFTLKTLNCWDKDQILFWSGPWKHDDFVSKFNFQKDRNGSWSLNLISYQSELFVYKLPQSNILVLWILLFYRCRWSFATNWTSIHAQKVSSGSVSLGIVGLRFLQSYTRSTMRAVESGVREKESWLDSFLSTLRLCLCSKCTVCCKNSIISFCSSCQQFIKW